MEIKEIKQIVDLMKRSDLIEFEIEESDLKLRICRAPKNGGQAQQVPVAFHGATNPPFLVEHQQPVSAPAAPQAAPAKSAEDDANVEYVKSPMVGTFYRASSPESSPYCEVGSSVSAEAVLCIVEAMKVMNEIHAEVSGKIIEVLVEDGQPVEYGQPLFKVKKA